jgi:hypothetical protein
MNRIRAVFLIVAALLPVLAVPLVNRAAERAPRSARRLWWVPLALLGLALAVGHQFRADAQDTALIRAIEAEDTWAALAALSAGADPNARKQPEDLPFPWRSVLSRLGYFVGGAPGATPGTHPAPMPTALLLALEPRAWDRPVSHTDPALWRGLGPVILRGHRPTFLKVPGEDTALVRALVERGAYTEARDANGHTPLMLAVRWGYLDTARVLLEYGADANARSRDALTPLMEAAEAEESGAVELLLANDAQVDIRDAQGLTALMYAASAGHNPAPPGVAARLRIAKRLLAAGAEPKLSNKDGQTALSLAKAEAPDLIPVLKAAGARK